MRANRASFSKERAQLVMRSQRGQSSGVASTLVKPSAAVEIADTQEARKARGAFFTPTAIARFITEWAVQSSGDRVMEPSCGDAEFLVEAVSRLRALGAKKPVVDGVEIHEGSAAVARERVVQAGGIPKISTSDFFLVDPAPTYSAVIGNPPFMRYQDFAGEARSRSRSAALRAGVPLSGLASSWAAFTIHSALFLAPNGRMGLVLPAELLSVNYAAVVRQFLFENFRSVDLVVFNERVFPEAEVDIVLLLADGYTSGPTDHATIYQAGNADDLATTIPAQRWIPANPAAKWTQSLLSSASLTAYSAVLQGDGFTNLETWGDTTLGMVSGNNKYFALSDERVASLGLEPSDLIVLSPPGSSHLRGLELSARNLRSLGASGSARWLFRPGVKPSPSALEYISAGEKAGVDQAYKCRVRKPWWRVPLVKPADLLLTYMNADTPRLTTNSAHAHHLNSVHGVYLRPEFSDLGRELLPVASLNSMTMLGAETVGRAYGGGILKIEPKEADVLPVPSPALVKRAAASLRAIRPRIARLLREGRLLDAAMLVDGVLLMKELGMTEEQVATLRSARADLVSRRVTRSLHG